MKCGSKSNDRRRRGMLHGLDADDHDRWMIKDISFLNNLKTLNETYGHDKGDLAIKKLSNLICRVFSHSPVFRIGGDEFAVILRGWDYEHYDTIISMQSGDG
jgi:diguanylate cyclase (GGDEF)-like protein